MRNRIDIEVVARRHCDLLPGEHPQATPALPQVLLQPQRTCDFIMVADHQKVKPGGGRFCQQSGRRGLAIGEDGVCVNVSGTQFAGGHGVLRTRLGHCRSPQSGKMCSRFPGQRFSGKDEFDKAFPQFPIIETATDYLCTSAHNQKIIGDAVTAVPEPGDFRIVGCACDQAVSETVLLCERNQR